METPSQPSDVSKQGTINMKDSPEFMHLLKNRLPPGTPKYQHKKTLQYVQKAKAAHRSDVPVNCWNKFGYCDTNVCEKLMRAPESIERVQIDNITPEEFIERFDKPQKPVIIEGMLSGWPGMQKWSLEYFDMVYRRGLFKVGEDDKGRKIRMRMKHFIDYCRHQNDDSPLYLFESSVESYGSTCRLLDDWDIPELFIYDLMSILGDRDRPPYRWFCVGPKRSGTTIHQDPLGTSAWNAVVCGHKRWVLAPPETPRKHIKGKHLRLPGEDDEAIMYFDYLLPRVKKTYPDLEILEGTQRPGDVIFVPALWWHAVVNIDDTIATTQNFVSNANLPLVWRCTRSSRPKLAVKWYKRLERFHPHLFQVIRGINLVDGYDNGSRGRFMRVRKIRSDDEWKSNISTSSSSSSSDPTSSDDTIELNEFEKQIRLREEKAPSCARVRYPYLESLMHIAIQSYIPSKFCTKQKKTTNSENELEHQIANTILSNSDSVSNDYTNQHIQCDDVNRRMEVEVSLKKRKSESSVDGCYRAVISRDEVSNDQLEQMQAK